MDINWASDHLQTIRTLMERAALYRRALAPVMIVSGSLGILGFLVSRFLKAATAQAFSLMWLAVGVIGLAAAFVMVRRQALKAAETIWSPPTRRVTSALLPAFLVGLTSGLYPVLGDGHSESWVIAMVWITAYGCALHAAGFFMHRGIKLFGWVFILGGCGALLLARWWPRMQTPEAAHYLMGFFFGVLHLSYGVYLYFTERQRAGS